MDPDEELESFVAGVQRRLQIRIYTESLLLALFIMLAYLGAVIYLGWFIVHEIREEMDFHDKYGGNWREVYEKYHGSLVHAQAKVAVCAGALVAVSAILIWFYRRMSSKRPSRIDCV